MGVWTNPDGLVVRLGPAEAFATRTGEFAESAFGYHVWDFHIKYTDFNSTTYTNLYASSPNGALSTVRIPRGIYLEKVEIFVKTAFVGASATLDVGLRRALDDGVTTISDTGLVAAAAVATLSIGATLSIVKGGTAAGALLGAVSDATYDGLVGVKANTAAFTAGEAVIKVYGRVINAHS